ncbi:MAG: TIGR02266 family protein [bacterium]|nr:TIGR02266 family protein [Myxococcales bacterium]
MAAEQRKAPRAPIEIKVEYRRLNAFIADYTRDLSRGGMFIETERPLASGDECLFTLHVPKLDEPITLRGVVRRVEAPGGHAPPGMGIELLFADDAERDALRQVVDGLMVEHLGMALYERMMRMRNRPGEQRASGGPQLAPGEGS